MEIELDLNIVSVEGGEVQFGKKKEVAKKIKIATNNEIPTTVFKAEVLAVVDTTNSYTTTNNFYNQQDSIGVVIRITDSALSVPRTIRVPLVSTSSDISADLIDNISELLETKYGIKENKKFKFKVKHNLIIHDDTVVTADDILTSLPNLRLYNAVRRALINQPKKLKEEDIF